MIMLIVMVFTVNNQKKKILISKHVELSNFIQEGNIFTLITKHGSVR